MNYTPLLINIEKIPLKFVDKMAKPQFKSIISNVVKNLFPNLDINDINILVILTTYVIDLISMKYGFNNNIMYTKQWEQNNYRDIKGVILLLLPYIDDKENGYLFNKITDLNQLLYAYKEQNIPEYINTLERETILSTHFEFGPMGIGMINSNNDNLLDLYENNEKTIYKVIFHNFIGLLQTLEIMNGKFYINWINIVPLNTNNYKESHLYMKTIERINLINNNPIEMILNTNLTSYYGLWFGDLYNVMRIKLYEEAKPIKWLIFPYTDKDNNNIYLIQGLNKMFNLDKILEKSDSDISELKKNLEIKVENLSEIYIEILKYFLINLVNNYKGTYDNDVYTNFKLEPEKEDDNKDDDYTKDNIKKIRNITYEDIKDCYNYLYTYNYEYIIDYLKDTLIEFKKTLYGKYIIVNNIITDYFYYNDSKLNLKNIYNVAKSLSHISHNDEWTLLDRNYISLKSESKQLFFNRIYNKVPNDWIVLNSNILRQYKYSGIKPNTNVMLTTIIEEFRKYFVDIVFEELITRGILNRFEPYLEITDKSILPSDFAPRKAMIKKLLEKKFKKEDNKKNYNDSYYYLTGTKFSDLKKIKVERKTPYAGDKYEEMTYFELIAKEMEWPIFYAMDWISQISFFQHYIYHQVLYVTGATGQGKSTQVPKLLLYALHAIDYKSNGKVICTQPRVTPTVGNATRIAEELGVPIEEPSNNSNIKIKTENNMIQFKHMKESYTVDNNSFLRIVTDGTLLEELIKNPTLKKSVNDMITNTNIYDIVIVDEAHEHNINMDLIIALAKQACYFNNMVRLIIVSATMDDDEPIYRRYFKDINDKLLFPIKFSIDAILGEYMIKQLPDPIYMDRRYHISPPGETTQYRVDEIYLETDIKQNNNKESSLVAMDKGYDAIIDICNKSITGEILFFANGMGEILKAVEHLNTILPDGNIALPFFSELNENYKDIITKIDSKISTIKTKRSNVHTEWGSNFIEDYSVPSGIYKRAIIIATNVAEASITINSLKYVVDNGYAKVNKFKPTIGITVLEVEEISEASRVQRKGRVGRVGDGIVYYMYPKYGRRNVKPKYKITQEDISPIVLKLMCKKDLNESLTVSDNENDSRLILTNKINPNLISFSSISNIKGNNMYIIDSKLYELYKMNYSINNTTLTSIYYKDMNTIMSNEFYVLNSGQIIYNILDKKGRFYLIHPFESIIKRNIMNDVIISNKKKSNEVLGYNYVYMLSYLFDKNLLIDMYAEKLFNNSYDILNYPRNFVITELTQKYQSLSSEFSTTIPETITLISASAMGCFNEVRRLMIFMKLISPPNSLTSIMKQDMKWKDFKKIYGSSENKSDIIFIHNIISSLHKQFDNLILFNVMKEEFNNRLQQRLDIELERFEKLYKKQKEPSLDFDGTLWNRFLQLKKNGKIKEEGLETFRTSNITMSIVMADLRSKYDKITKWCENNYLNSDVIIQYLNNFAKYYLNKNINENNKEILWARQLSSNFNRYLTTGTIEEKIIRSFLYGYPSQYTYSINNNNKFVTYLNRSLHPVKFAEPFYENQGSETLTSLSNELTFYYAFNEVEDLNLVKDINTPNTLNVMILSQIQIEWLIPALPLFMNPLCTPDVVLTTAFENEMQSIDYPNSSGIDRFKREIINTWDRNYTIWDYDDTPLLQYFYKKINKTISKYMRNY